MTNTLNTRHPRESNVGEDHIRILCFNAPQRFFHRTMTAGAGKAISAVDQRSQAFTDLAHVFDDHHADERVTRAGSACLRLCVLSQEIHTEIECLKALTLDSCRPFVTYS